MKGVRQVTADDALKALTGASSVAAAARAAGCSRALLHKRAQEDSRVMEALRAVTKPSAPPTERTERRHRAEVRIEAPPELIDDPDVVLALATLRAVAKGERDGEDCSPSAHVAAAKALLAAAESRVAAARLAAAAAKAPEVRAEGLDVARDDEVAGGKPPPLNLERARAAVLGL